MTLAVLADENIPAVEHYVGSLGRVTRCNGRTLHSAQLAGVDVLLVRSVTQVDEQLLAGSAVRFVGTATSGVDHVDRSWLQQQGIGFCHAPGANANSVVEYVLAAIAAVGDHLETLLGGGRVGIVGYGHIGRALAARLECLGIACLVSDPWLEQGTVGHAASLDEVLRCDVISLHPELTREQPWPSYHLLGERELSLLRPGCLLVNASRGPVVDNRALYRLLVRERAPDVVLDVWEGEPHIDTDLLQRVRLGTAHIAGYSLDGKLLATQMLVAAMANQLGVAWHDPGSAAGEPAAICLHAELEPATLLRHLLEQRYPIARDDAALRQVATGPGAEPGGFDRLRREYPPRRERLASRVVVTDPDAATLAMVRGLGCRIENNANPPGTD